MVLVLLCHALFDWASLHFSRNGLFRGRTLLLWSPAGFYFIYIFLCVREGIRDVVLSLGLGDVYEREVCVCVCVCLKCMYVCLYVCVCVCAGGYVCMYV